MIEIFNIIQTLEYAVFYHSEAWGGGFQPMLLAQFSCDLDAIDCAFMFTEEDASAIITVVEI